MMRNDSKLDDYTEDLAYRVIGAIIEVHRILGPGLLEGIYENALCIELAERNIKSCFSYLRGESLLRVEYLI